MIPARRQGHSRGDRRRGGESAVGGVKTKTTSRYVTEMVTVVLKENIDLLLSSKEPFW